MLEFRQVYKKINEKDQKKIYDPPLRFKMTPTPSEMAFDPL